MTPWIFRFVDDHISIISQSKYEKSQTWVRQWYEVQEYATVDIAQLTIKTEK